MQLSKQLEIGTPLLTWALCGGQQRRCIRARLYRTPAFSVYLKEEKKQIDFQTAKKRGMIL